MITLFAYISLIIFVVFLLSFIMAKLTFALLNVMTKWSAGQQIVGFVGIAFIFALNLFLNLTIIFYFVHKIGY